MTEWTPEAQAANQARRQRWIDAGYCPDSGERMVVTDTIWGDRLMCPLCDCFGEPVE